MIPGIKAPQLIGIICGCAVFTVTIFTVVVLLIKSNTIKGFLDEVRGMRGGASLSSTLDNGSSGGGSSDQRADPSLMRQGVAELFDCLLRVREVLPTRLRVPTRQGEEVGIRPLSGADVDKLSSASNGSAIFDGSAYPLSQIWYWLELGVGTGAGGEDISEGSAALFQTLLLKESAQGERTTNVVIFDVVLDTPVGMLQLTNNSPENLTLEVSNVWLTPAYRGKRHAHAALLLVLDWLFSLGYRRLEARTDTLNVIANKFLQRCGFSLESVMRKHRVVEKRNRDTSVYRLLNSDWPVASMALHRVVGRKYVPTVFPFDTDDSDAVEAIAAGSG